MKNFLSPRRIILFGIIFTFLSVWLSACTSEPDLEPNKDVVPVPKLSVKNPFSTENIEQAFANLAARSNGRIKVVAPSTTHNYVRFEPQNLDQIMLIHDLGYELWDEPLDQDLDYSGDYYHHPGLPDSLNYFYTLIPANYSIIQTVPHSVLGQVVLFDEDAGDEQDPEDVPEDPWIPAPEPCIELPYCEPYVYCPPCVNRIKTSQGQKPEDLVKKTTKYLLDAGVDLVELYNEAMRLAGYEDEVIDGSPDGRTQSVRYYPSGQILVHDNSVNQNVPVVGTFVKSRRFFKLAHTYTNASGNFQINKGYRNKAQIIVKFKNDWAKIRGVNGGLKIWQWTHPVKVKLGLYEKSAMQSISKTFQYTSNADTRQAIQFTAAHVINTLHNINQYAAINGLNTTPGNMNIWVTTSNWFPSSTAPMLHKVLEPAQTTNWLNLFLSPPKTGWSLAVRTLFGILTRYAPDVAITINNDSQNGPAKTAQEIVGISFHELGHTIHYNKVGRSYWINVIAQYISNKLNAGTAYGNKNNLTAVVESWGYFSQLTFTDIKYRAIGTSAAILIANENRNLLENQVPGNASPEQWIPYGALHDLRDVGEPLFTGVVDNVSNYTINGVFKGYTSNITTVQGLKQNILNQNGNSQATQVNQLITSYGW